jgi:DNA-binding CsgD family transcriptional regulator
MAAADELCRDADAGMLAPEAVNAVLIAARQPRRSLRRPAGLSERECEVLGLLARGLATKQVARRLGISPKTCDHHIQRLYGQEACPPGRAQPYSRSSTDSSARIRPASPQAGCPPARKSAAARLPRFWYWGVLPIAGAGRTRLTSASRRPQEVVTVLRLFPAQQRRGSLS